MTQYLGIPEDEIEIETHIEEIEIRTGEIYLICSDGLTDMVTDEIIKDTVPSASLKYLSHTGQYQQAVTPSSVQVAALYSATTSI